MKIDTNECWLFAGHVDKKEYGHIWDGFRDRTANQFMYMAHKGEIPEGLEVDHICNIRRCVNPDHLQLLTHKQNVQKRWGKDLCIRGHKLTPTNSYVSVKDKKTGRVGRQCKMCLYKKLGRKEERR